ncbi:MAG: ribosomal L7Ae/L30e/S12e/Gadd45 family protein [Clostridia bacterium]|nr:ribosomal L7Ae/L30e/S12e/Gadd45 family protein [Clostridia bacterium]
MKAGKLAYGTDMCLDKIKFKKAKLVIISEDASNNNKERFKRICEENDISFYEYGNKEDISFAIGKSNKSVVAVLDNNFAKSINKMFEDLKGAII